MLDEPTNHLDIAARDALESVLSGFAGTLIFVSHDRYLIDSLVGELWVLQDGRLVRYAGTYSDYAGGRAKPLDRDQGERKSSHPPDESPEARVDRLEDEAEALAGRLAQAGSVVGLAQVADLSDRYEQILISLQEAQHTWIADVRSRIRGFSGSQARSAAEKQR
jgi:ATP-binding cassette subfamily F protein 3